MARVKNKREKKEKRFHLFPRSAALTVVMVMVLLIEVVFMALVFMVGVLPVKYLAILIAVLVLVDFGIFTLLNSRKRRTNKRLVGTILSVLMINVLVLGCSYMFNTYDTFQKISGGGNQYEDYHVVVLKDSNIENVKQLQGRDVYVTDANSKMYKEAKEKLLTEVEVVYKAEPDMLAVGHKLVDEEGATHNAVIFVSDGNYSMLCEEIKGFRKNTKKMHSIPVVVRSNDSAKRIDVTKDPFNIYISGIDAWGDIEKVSRSDVNMIVTVNPQTKTVLLTSMPRDSYVMLHSYGQMDKLTHTGVYGIEETTSTVEDWLGIDVNYYARVNFSMLVSLIDAIDGIDVESDFAFKSKIAEYTYEVGMNHMNGKEALYFARERKAFEDEDEERIRNQQKVLKATLDKITRSEVILTNYVDILNAVEGKMQTSLTDKDMAALVKMQLKDMSPWTIKSISIDGDDAMKGTYSMGMGRELFVSIPKEESVKKAVEKMHEVMYPAPEEEKKL